MKSIYFVCLVFLFGTVVFSQSTREAKTLPPAIGPMRSAQMAKGSIPPGSAVRQKDNVESSSGVLNFAPPMSYASGGSGGNSAAVADVNGDGKLDIVIANECASASDCTKGTLGVLLGNGDGTFGAANVFDSGQTFPMAVAIQDVNGDSKPDLIVAECIGDNGCLDNGDGVVGVLLGNGDGTFQGVVIYDAGGNDPDSVAVADVNADGKPDIVVANGCASSTFCESNGSVSVLLGNGDGTFQPALAYQVIDRNTSSIAVADLNGDGNLDIVAANALGKMGLSGQQSSANVFLNSNGTFSGSTLYRSGGYGTDSVAIADVNGDGKLDLILANSCSPPNVLACGTKTRASVGVLLGNGDGTFRSVVTYDSGGYSGTSAAVADLNGDGKPDVAIVNRCVDSSCTTNGSVGVLVGNGDGTFQAALPFGLGAETGTVVLADLNADGKPDMVVANGSANVLLNTSIGATTTALVSSINPSTFGQSVTFTATVTKQGFGVTPTGTVTFLDGATSLGSSALDSSGIGSFTTSTLSIGAHSITATYNGDANFAASTSPLVSQVVQGAIAQISPASLNFGNQTVGIVSASQPVTLSNTGSVALTIASIQITGTNSGDFAQTNTCGTSVAAGGSCTITVTFTPIATGTRNAAVTITDNASDSPQSVTLTGVGVAPAVSLSPTSLTFATQVVFTISKAQIVTLTNTGAGVLTISRISASSQFIQTNTCGTSVAAGASCTITVTFRPSAINTISGFVSIADNASGSPQKVILKGTGTYVQLTPATLNFGNQPVGTTSLGKKITLSNKGSVSVGITSISITGTNKTDFALTNTCGTSVAAGSSCFITVTFTPSAKGSRSAAVSVSDNGGGSPQKVNVVGSGT